MLEVAVSQQDGVEHGAVRTGHDELTAQQRLRGLPVLAKELLAGGAAGGLAKTAVAPLERVKILFQTGRMRGRGVGETLVDILAREGPQGLFRGNGASVLRIIPYAALHFSAYESYRELLVKAAAAAAQKPLSDFVVPPYLDLIAGSAAGATAVLVTYPLDLVRTRLAYGLENGAGNATSDAVRRLSSAAASAGPGSAAAASAAAPPHLLHAAQHHPKRATIRGILKSTVRQEGALGLYRGIGPTLCGILPYAGLKFYVYQSLKQQYRRYWEVGRGEGDQQRLRKLPVPLMLAFGATAGLIAQTVTYPLDVVRRQMQVQGLREAAAGTAGARPEVPHIRSTWQGLRVIAAQQGTKALFAGLSLNYLKVVPSTAIGFTIYDALKSYLDLPQHL